ncbi:prion-inhibition and propagation-domain-containing protein [Podospora didyma]|uniref:Prion-inhibition and propagation-domain-containing protein n=1 Tax=Podospora didyma TaxID=330526 RepID=A0AAE0KEL5_9PEZI|nr:prion-inhibition and propagation-domain-containing protein [Podospora didyma]
MDPVSAAGLALGVASIGLQIYTGAIQGIQLLITAISFPEDCRYLNLRLRMEQQRLFAWSETSGLLDVNAKDKQKILETNTFILHRQTVLDLLVQVQCLFKEFKEHQERNQRLQTVPDQDQVLGKPEKDAEAANFPLPERRRAFIKKAMLSLRETSQEAIMRLRWVTFDKPAFELLLSRFSALNDNMTNILDARMQVEIHHTVQDTNRGVLQLHHKITDLSRLVMALNIKLEASSAPLESQMSASQKRANADGLHILSQLAKFKAFNKSIETNTRTPWDEATVMCLELRGPNEQKNLVLNRSMIEIDPAAEESDLPRCEAILQLPDGARRKVWVEWKEYDPQKPGDISPPKDVIFERVQMLAALLNHTPKPEAFRTPHCLGFFDRASSGGAPDEDEDSLNMRLGLVFERPQDDDLHTSLPPVSLRELLQKDRKPRVTDRIKLAHAISNCLLYLHAVNWLHKGLRSHNVVFFRTSRGHVDYTKPYLSGFGISRPARSDEMTQGPDDDVENNLYRHPHAQSINPADRERFKRSFDIYSLGVVLAEIAHWKTVDAIIGIDLNGSRIRSSIALRVRDILLADDQIEELGACMGGVYEKAAKKCLAGGEELKLFESDDETNDVVAARLSMVLHEDVVKPLGDVRI